jgi:hypothetical protein
MSSTIKIAYGTQGVAITISLNSLGNTSEQQSTAVDNTSNLYLDALVQFKIKTGASGTSATGVVRIYFYATSDNGTDYTDGATGSDGSFTPTSPANARVAYSLNCVANATTYTSDPISVAAAYGGVLPAKWGIIIENQSGHALDASAGGSAWYQGIQQTVG